VVAARLSDLASEQPDSILYVSGQCYPRGCRIENIHRVRLPYTVPSVVISLVIGSPMENFGSATDGPSRGHTGWLKIIIRIGVLLSHGYHYGPSRPSAQCAKSLIRPSSAFAETPATACRSREAQFTNTVALYGNDPWPPFPTIPPKFALPRGRFLASAASKSSFPRAMYSPRVTPWTCWWR